MIQLNFSKSLNTILIISFSTLLVSGCHPTKVQNEEKSSQILIDTIATELLQTKIDTLTIKSDYFLLNGKLRYWHHFLTIYDDSYYDILMQLKDKATDLVLLEYEFSPKYNEDYDYKSVDYFANINKNHFRDLNFDGFLDFYIYSHGSMPMTSSTNIYLFNPQNQLFEYSEILTDNSIEEVDSLRRILTTTSFNMETSYQKKHFFDQKGNFLFSEFRSETDIEVADTFIKKVVYYEKIVNGEVKISKIDTLLAD